MIDLDKLNRDLQEVAQAANNGHLTRGELTQLRMNLGWTLVATRTALERARRSNQRSYP